MQAVKFLERPKVIRFFGICLLLAPFINVGINIFLQTQKSQVTSMIVWKSLMVGTLAQNMQNLLSLGSFVIGAVMMFGKRKAWTFVLGLIGLHVIIQTITLMKDIKENWVWGIVFLINLAVFFFIADQLVFKEKRAGEAEDDAEGNNVASAVQAYDKSRTQDNVGKEVQASSTIVSVPAADASTSVSVPAADASTSVSMPAADASTSVSELAADASTSVSELAADASTSVSELATVAGTFETAPAGTNAYAGLVTRKRIIIHFSDINLWAQLLHISNQGLTVKAMENKAIEVMKKPMVVFLRKDLPLKLMLDTVKNGQCFFQFFPMSTTEVTALNQWILEKADVKRVPSESGFNSLSFTQKVS